VDLAANIFVHFEPTGRPLSDTTDGVYLDTMDGFLPPYVLPGTPWAATWAKYNPGSWNRASPSAPRQHSNMPSQHYAAATGDLARLQEIATSGSFVANLKDENGWQAFHEAARAGHIEIVQFFAEDYKIDINLRYGRREDGGSVLNLALEGNSDDSLIVKYLRKLGAEDLPPLTQVLQL
jgi:prolyl 4-hydroxylase